MANAKSTYISLTLVCLSSWLCVFRASNGGPYVEAKATENDTLAQFLNSKSFVDGTIGNVLPKSSWWQIRCLQPLPKPLPVCGYNVLSAFASYDIINRRCVEQIGQICTNGLPNLFTTLDSCVSNCMPTNQTDSICKLLPEPGFKSEIGGCHESKYRWFYNDGECYQFLYSGCGGNMNNFPSRESCLHFCSGKGELQTISKPTDRLNYGLGRNLFDPNRFSKIFVQGYEPIVIVNGQSKGKNSSASGDGGLKGSSDSSPSRNSYHKSTKKPQRKQPKKDRSNRPLKNPVKKERKASGLRNDQ